MMATSKIMLDQEPSEIELLLPFHATGTLNARDARRVDDALAGELRTRLDFAANGITNGELLDGVKYFGACASTDSRFTNRAPLDLG